MLVRRTLEDQAYELLQKMIVKGELAMGRLYSESEMAKQFSISRTPVRTAIQHLEKDGLVTILTNRGFCVREFTERDIREVYELRKVLETYAIERFIDEKKDVKELCKTIERLKTHAEAGDLASVTEQDRKFHLLLIKETGNTRLEADYGDLRILILAMTMQALQLPGHPQRTADEHSEIVRAIERGDSSRAKEALYKHFDNATQRLVETMESSDKAHRREGNREIRLK